MLKSRRKTCIIGFVTTVHSICDLAKELFESKTESFSYFSTYLLQQDFLEHFFSLLRQHGGWNDNPSCLQIKYIMRKLIVNGCNGLTASLYSNCTPNILVDIELEENERLSDNNITVVIEMAEKLDVKCSTSPEEALLENFKKRIVAYISGYVVSKVYQNVGCKTCQAALFDSPLDPIDSQFSRLVLLRSNGSLKIPSNSRFKVILKAEEVFRRDVVGQNTLSKNDNLITLLSNKVVRLLDLSSFFPTSESHILDQNPAMEQIHNVSLVKIIVFRYLKVRCLSYCKVFTSNIKTSTSSRNQSLKLTHFRHE